MQELKSFKKYSWLISILFALIVFVSGLTASDISFLPAKYQSFAVGVIGACALLVKIFPENFRVKVAENTARKEAIPTGEFIRKNDLGDEDGA